MLSKPLVVHAAEVAGSVNVKMPVETLLVVALYPLALSMVLEPLLIRCLFDDVPDVGSFTIASVITPRIVPDIPAVAVDSNPNSATLSPEPVPHCM